MSEPHRYAVEMTIERLGRAQNAVSAIQRAQSRANEERWRKRLSFGVPNRTKRTIGVVLGLGGETVCLAAIPILVLSHRFGMAAVFGALALLYLFVVLAWFFKDPMVARLHAFTDRMIDSRVARLFALLSRRAPYTIEYELHDDRIVARAPILKSERTDPFSLYRSALRGEGVFYLRRKRSRLDRIVYFERAEDADALTARLATAGIALEAW